MTKKAISKKENGTISYGVIIGLAFVTVMGFFGIARLSFGLSFLQSQISPEALHYMRVGLLYVKIPLYTLGVLVLWMTFWAISEVYMTVSRKKPKRK